MLTNLKKLQINIFNWWKDQYIYWIYIQSWYLIKFRKVRHLKLDWAMTQKFFSRTFASFYLAKYFSHQIFFFFKVINYNPSPWVSNLWPVYYWFVKIYYLYDQFIEISFTILEQHTRWKFLEYFYLTDFPYIYDKIDRKKRWSKVWRHWAKKYIITIKYYSGKITSFKGSE